MTLAECLEHAHELNTPARHLQALDAFRATATQSEFYNSPACQPLRELWQAIYFGLGHWAHFQRPLKVRICHPDQFPDFEAEIEGRTYPFECTMYTEERLGERFRDQMDQGAPEIVHPGPLPELNTEEVSRAVRRKVERRYPPDTNLLLYLNCEGSAVQAETVRDAVLAGGGDYFKSVWVLAGFALTCAIPCEELGAMALWQQVPREVSLETGQ